MTLSEATGSSTCPAITRWTRRRRGSREFWTRRESHCSRWSTTAEKRKKVGMKMPPTKLLIFGSPKAGTPVMLAAPSIAIDLPLKILVWEDGQGKVWVSYNSPAYLQERHGVPAGVAAEHRSRGNIGSQGRGVAPANYAGGSSSRFPASHERRLVAWHRVWGRRGNGYSATIYTSRFGD